MKRGRRRVRSGPRRQTDWIPFDIRDLQGVPVGGTTYALIDPLDMGLKDGACTVERCVGRVLVYDGRDAVGNPGNFFIVHAGILVQNLDGAGNVYNIKVTLGLDMELPWLWRKSWTVNGFTGAFPDRTVIGYEQGWRFIDFDVHVRRKLQDRSVLTMILELEPVAAPGIDGIATATAHIEARTLVKLT